MRPIWVIDGPPRGTLFASHLAIQGFYVKRVVLQLKEMEQVLRELSGPQMSCAHSAWLQRPRGRGARHRAGRVPAGFGSGTRSAGRHWSHGTPSCPTNSTPRNSTAPAGRYLAAEQRIFEEVRTEVTQKLPPEERVPVNRYFEGSPVYPGHFADDWNRSHVLEPDGTPRGCGRAAARADRCALQPAAYRASSTATAALSRSSPSACRRTAPCRRRSPRSNGRTGRRRRGSRSARRAGASGRASRCISSASPMAARWRCSTRWTRSRTPS